MARRADIPEYCQRRLFICRTAHTWCASRQAKRVETLVVMLTALLRRWVEGDEQGFKVPAQNTAWPACQKRGLQLPCFFWMLAIPSARC